MKEVYMEKILSPDCTGTDNLTDNNQMEIHNNSSKSYKQGLLNKNTQKPNCKVEPTDVSSSVRTADISYTIQHRTVLTIFRADELMR